LASAGKSGIRAKKENAALNFCKNAKRRAAFVHNMRLDIIPLIEYN
jgi:hypothetical protein